MQCFPKTKLLFFRRRFFLNPEDHAEQTGQQLRALDNNDFHMELLSNTHVICHRHTFRVLCPQYIHFSKKGAEKRPEGLWLPNAFPAAPYKLCAVLHFMYSYFPHLRVLLSPNAVHAAVRYIFLSGYFFAAKTDRFSLVLFLSFVFLLFFCFLSMLDVHMQLELPCRQHHAQRCHRQQNTISCLLQLQEK